MAIINRLSDAQIREHFTHYGLMFKFVPVYIGKPGSAEPIVAVRNWWPEWLLDVCEAIFSLCVRLQQMTDPLYEADYPMLVGDEIK